MTQKYIYVVKVATALKIAACAVDCYDDGITLNDAYNLIDNAFRTVLGDKTFDELKEAYLFLNDDEVDDPETPKF